MIIGIDPGQTGALAFVENGKVVQVIDMPTMARTHGKGNQVDPYSLSLELCKIGTARIDGVVMEQVAAMPGQGVTSVFNFGESVGIVKGVLGSLQLPVRMVTPQKWKKTANLIGKDKDAARSLAIQLHPEAAEFLSRKKDVGRADAICIARFG